MNRTALFILSVVVSALASFHAAAAADPCEHLRQLDWIIGEWDGEYVLPNDVGPFPTGTVVTQCVEVRWMFDDQFIFWHISMEADGRSADVRREITGWDHEAKVLRHWGFGMTGRGEGTCKPTDDGLEILWSVVGATGTRTGTGHLRRVDEITLVVQQRGITVNGEAVADLPPVTFRRRIGPAPDPRDESYAVPPPEVHKHFHYFVGDWEVRGNVDEEEFVAEYSYDWTPGGHVLVYHWHGGFGATRVHGSAMVGWDSKARQVVDTGFVRELGWRVVRYTPHEAEAWKGETVGVIWGEPVRAGVELQIIDADHFVITSSAAPNNPRQEYRFFRVIGEEASDLDNSR